MLGTILSKHKQSESLAWTPQEDSRGWRDQREFSSKATEAQRSCDKMGIELQMVVRACNPRIWEVGAGGSDVQKTVSAV